MAAQSDDPFKDLIDGIKKKNLDKVRDAILEGADVNKMTTFKKIKMTPLHLAIIKKNLKICKCLIKYKADVNAKAFPSGRTPLHYASEWALHKIVKELLEKGADPIAEDNDGKTALNIIGAKYEDNDMSMKVLDGKSECQILLLTAAAEATEQKNQERNAGIADIVTGFQKLKQESDARVKAVEKAQGKKFDQVHAYMCVAKNRHKVWVKENGKVRDYLEKRFIEAPYKTYSDEDEVHFNFRKVPDFQKTLVVEMLRKGGLVLQPEECPPKWKKKG